MNDGPQFSLMKLMGHASFKTTERYSHLSPNHLLGLRELVKFNLDQKGEILSVSDYKAKQIDSRQMHANTV